MKKTISILTGSLLACAAMAGDDPNMIRLSPTPQTNATAVAAGQATSPQKLSGYVDTIIIDVGGGGGAPTSTVVVATVGSESTGAARTILTLTDVAADGSYPVRDLVTTQAGVDIANTPARVPLIMDKIIVSAYGANTTTNTVDVYIVLTKRP